MRGRKYAAGKVKGEGETAAVKNLKVHENPRQTLSQCSQELAAALDAPPEWNSRLLSSLEPLK